MSNTEKLLDLIQKNPELPIVPLVDSEVVAGDEFGWWLGQWGKADVTEYYLGREGIHFKDDDEENILSDLDGCRYGHDQDDRDIYELSDDEWNKLYASIPWTKAIVVHITL